MFSSFCLILLLLTVAFPTTAVAQSKPVTEYEIKAAFLYNFTKFVEWPPDTFQNEKSPIAICIFGNDPFGTILDDTIQGKVINKRALSLRRIHEPRELKSCQLVFVPGKESKRLPEILESLKRSSVLVVGETEGFAERGGGIQLFLEENKMRFSVNVDTIHRARLNISSKLLALARIVHDEDHAKGG